MSGVTFFNITDPFNMETTPEPEAEHRPDSTPIIVPQIEERSAENYFNMPFDQASGLEALSEAATSNFQYIRLVSVPGHSPGDTNASPHSSNNLNFILNPTEADGSVGTLKTPRTTSCSALKLTIGTPSRHAITCNRPHTNTLFHTAQRSKASQRP
jgi:hypothetical protein